MEKVPVDYAKMKVFQLREELKKRRLRIYGRKQELVERLVTHDKLNCKHATEELEKEEEKEEKIEAPSSLIDDISEEDTPPAPQEKLPWSPCLPKQSSTTSIGEVPSAKKISSGNPFNSSISLLDSSSSILNTSTSSPKRVLFGTAEFKTPDQKKSRVSFGSVEVRKYRVSHGGALGTPSKGAYPIGLSWDITDQEVKPLPLEEKKNSVVKKLTEKDRKRLLEKHDIRSYFEKQASFETEREELKQLRRARLNTGCGCNSTNACGTSKCVCFKEGLACTDDSCGCTQESCINPSRHNFDQDKVDIYRKQKILEAPYTECADENSCSPIKM